MTETKRRSRGTRATWVVEAVDHVAEDVAPDLVDPDGDALPPGGPPAPTSTSRRRTVRRHSSKRPGGLPDDPGGVLRRPTAAAQPGVHEQVTVGGTVVRTCAADATTSMHRRVAVRRRRDLDSRRSGRWHEAGPPAPTGTCGNGGRSRSAVAFVDRVTRRHGGDRANPRPAGRVRHPDLGAILGAPRLTFCRTCGPEVCTGGQRRPAGRSGRAPAPAPGALLRPARPRHRPGASLLCGNFVPRAVRAW